MQAMSTDQPPRFSMVIPLAAVTSTDQPPKRSYQFLEALSTGQALGTLDFWRIRVLMEQGLISSVAVGRRTPHTETQQQKDEADKLARHSPDVMQTLATADFWACTRVSGAPWSTSGGIAASVMSLEPRGAPATPWKITLPAVGKAAYETSVMGVPTTMSGAPPNILQQVLAQASLPHLFLPIALGMANSHADLRPFTCALVDVVHDVVNVAVHRLKHQLRVPRPDDKTAAAFPFSTVVPLIPVPGYSAYPSGHSTLMFALATVLSDVVAANITQTDALHTLALAIARNRELAGLHTAVDTAAGDQLGRAIGSWMLQAAAHPEFGPWSGMYAMAAREWA